MRHDTDCLLIKLLLLCFLFFFFEHLTVKSEQICVAVEPVLRGHPREGQKVAA